ncbi:MAG: F0F1 ATP synthase subunit A, partial [Candidatus Omnitrophica bacterium]|nr:F0F1 ATP synthase subunit A [Candidatus Omnitrophota bacterium]
MAAEHAVEHAAAHLPAAHHAAQAGGEIPELPNLITLLSSRWHDHPLVAWLHHWENLVFACLVAAGLSCLAWRYARRPQLIPGGGQNALELLVEGIDRFVHSIIGRAGRRHTPFIGTLFLYIWLMNLSVLIPGLKSSTSSLN